MSPHYSNVLRIIFNDCLFDVPTTDNHSGACSPPKCKSEGARSAAFDLLLALIDDDVNNYVQLTELLLLQLDRGEALFYF